MRREIVRPSPTVRERFEAKVERIPFHSCWEWNGSVNNAGYGQLFLGKDEAGVAVVEHAHRLAYVFHCGEIPEGMEIDHLCRNKTCVNPDHMELVTHAENMRRWTSLLPSQSSFRCGHPFVEENIYRKREEASDRYPQGKARCRECRRQYRRRYHRERKAQQ